MIQPSNPQAEAFAAQFNLLLGNIELVVKGKRDHIAMTLVCIFAEGHLLIEDVPGTGKTVLAKALATSIGGDWSRIQFTPDLLPSDVTGGLVYNQTDGRFDLHRGPVFNNVVLADEINRASPKTQSALLEVMAERQVTIGNETHAAPRPFVVLATQNPVEQAGTYRLPEAQLDRFLMRTSLGYPDEEAEIDVLRSAGRGLTDVQPVLSAGTIRHMIAVADAVHVDDSIHRYIVALARASRAMPQLRLGVSTRGSLAMLRAARSLAASQARAFVKVDDVKTIAPFVIAHRLLLTPEAELARVSQNDLVLQLLDQVEVPRRVQAA